MKPIHVPTFKGTFRIDRVPGEGSVLISEAGQLALLEETVEQRVCDLIDGTRSVDDITSALNGCVARQDVVFAINMMRDRGIITDSQLLAPLSEPEFWHCFYDGSMTDMLSRSGCAISVQCHNGVRQEDVQSAMERFGIRCAPDAALSVVFVSDYLDKSLEDINRDMILRCQTWLLAKPVGQFPIFGPLLIPGQTGCWECLAQRLRNARALEMFVQQAVRHSYSHGKHDEYTLSAAIDIICVQISRLLLTGHNGILEDGLVSLDIATMASTKHTTIRRPQCSVCGQTEGRGSKFLPPKLRNRPKVVRDGKVSHRLQTVDEIYSSLAKHISPLSGIVTDVASQSGVGEEVLSLCTAGHNFVLGGDSLRTIRDGLQMRSAGKGATEAEARAGALCEALERYSATYRGDEYCITTSKESLGARAIDLNDCMLYSQSQIANREKWAALNSAFNAVPPRVLQETEQIEWAPMWSLATREVKYIPSAYLFYGYPIDHRNAFCWANSNGTAAGSSYEEAVLEGFFEVVERDCVAMWWYNRIQRPRLDLSSFGDPYVNRCIDFYRRYGREVWALDLTNDFGISTFVVLSRRTNQLPEEIIFGFGTHLDAGVALSRAMSEMNQFLPAVNGPLASDGSRVYAYGDTHASSWWRNATVDNQQYLQPQSSQVRGRSDFRDLGSDDQLIDLMKCVLRCQSMGLEFLVYDYTQADIELNVCKVVVPGARHFWARYAPGRLYDVPVACGWLAVPNCEDNLNPIPLFV